MSNSTADHKVNAPFHLNFALITISTSRYLELQAGRPIENPSGDLVSQLLEAQGYSLISNDVISDDAYLIRTKLEQIVNISHVDVVVMCGGTGIAKTDITIETITPLIEKDLPGFGEIFRQLSYESMGSAALLSRATAGLVGGKVVFCLPGSPQAVELAMRKLILPEAGHLVKHANE